MEDGYKGSTQNNSIDFSKKVAIMCNMKIEEARVPSNEEAQVPPTDAVDVLYDNQWHMALAQDGLTMHSGNYDPLRLDMFGSVDAPLYARSELPEEEPTYQVDFVRNQGSWGREGEALICKGLAMAEGKEIPTRLLVWDDGGGTGIFLHSITDNPQSNRR